MPENRRRYRRFTGPYDGSWDRSAGARDCRVTDLSPGGCFIDSFGPGLSDDGGSVSLLSERRAETTSMLPIVSNG
jgi:hypothetical protein